MASSLHFSCSGWLFFALSLMACAIDTEGSLDAALIQGGGTTQGGSGGLGGSLGQSGQEDAGDGGGGNEPGGNEPGGTGGSTTAGIGGDAGTGGNTAAGVGGSTTAGAGGSDAGQGGNIAPGQGGSTTAGTGGSKAGAGGTGQGGSTTAGAGGAGQGGSTTAGAGGTGQGGSTTAGAGGTGQGGSTTAGAGGSDAGQGGSPTAGAGGGGPLMGSNGEICYETGTEKSVTMQCPSNEVIQAVTFASYGTPDGQCGSYLLDSSCDIPGFKSKVEELCLQQDICTVSFEDLTPGTGCPSDGLLAKIETFCGKPTCGDGVLDAHEPCDGKWQNDPVCSDKCVLTCEAKGGTLSEDSKTCYLPNSKSDTWNNAKNACTSLGNHCHLATINSEEERQLIAKMAGPKTIWLGGYLNPSAWGSMPSYLWITGEPWEYGPSAQGLKDKKGGLPPWDQDHKEPNNEEPCVELKYKSPETLNEMNDTSCSSQNPWICECDVPGDLCNRDGKIDPGEECDDGNSTDADGCSSSCEVECPSSDLVKAEVPGAIGALKDPISHSCYVLLGTDSTQAEAKVACGALNPKWGGKFHLARIESLNEFYLLSSAVAAEIGTDKSAWIDGSDQAKEGTWIFETTNQPIPFKQKEVPWGKDEPGGGKNENCLSFWWKSDWDKGAYMLADLGCETKTKVLCEQEPISQ